MTRQGVAFTPAKTRKWETTCRLIAQQRMQQREPIAGPVRVTVVAQFLPSASWPAWKREAAARGFIAPTGRPDVENISKAACDALNSVVYGDDSQIVELVARKAYSAKPRVTVLVQPLHMKPCQITKKSQLED